MGLGKFARYAALTLLFPAFLSGEKTDLNGGIYSRDENKIKSYGMNSEVLGYASEKFKKDMTLLKEGLIFDILDDDKKRDTKCLDALLEKHGAALGQEAVDYFKANPNVVNPSMEFEHMRILYENEGVTTKLYTALSDDVFLGSKGLDYATANELLIQIDKPRFKKIGPVIDNFFDGDLSFKDMRNTMMGYHNEFYDCVYGG